MTTTNEKRVIPPEEIAAPVKAAATTTSRDYPSQEATSVGSSLSRAIVEPQKQQWIVSPQIEIVRQEDLWLVRTSRYPDVVATVEPRMAASLLAAGRIQTTDITRQTSPTADLEAAVRYIEQVDVYLEVKRLFQEEVSIGQRRRESLKETSVSLTQVTVNLEKKMMALRSTEYLLVRRKKKP